MEKLSTFEAAYVEAALWSSTGDDDQPLDKKYSVNDISPYALIRMRRDCALFQLTAAWRDHGSAYAPSQWSDDERGGHDFWLTRNGHGCGFWDREWTDGSKGEELTQVCKVFGEVGLYVSDEGKIEGGY